MHFIIRITPNAHSTRYVYISSNKLILLYLKTHLGLSKIHELYDVLGTI